MYQLYFFSDWRHHLYITREKLTDLVRNFKWQRGLPGGWLEYAPPRCVTAFGNGQLYSEEGKAYGDKYNYTAWRASTPASYCTAVAKTAPLPKAFIESGIMSALRNLLREQGVMVDDSTCTGMWCNYYNRPEDNISPHTDDEDYYARNYENDTIFVSFTLYEDEVDDYYNMARFQIKKEGSWTDLVLPHLSLLVMSGNCEHRVLKAKKDQFRPRYNITFRTPVRREIDVLKNYRFFSNFGRYYRQTVLLYVPEKAFLQSPGKKKLYYHKGAYAQDNKGNKYKLNLDNSYTAKTIYFFSQYAPLNLQLNSIESREEILAKVSLVKAPPTSTKEALLVLLKQEKIEIEEKYED